jgi:hypothetical protein
MDFTCILGDTRHPAIDADQTPPNDCLWLDRGRSLAHGATNTSWNDRELLSVS